MITVECTKENVVGAYRTTAILRHDFAMLGWRPLETKRGAGFIEPGTRLKVGNR